MAVRDYPSVPLAFFMQQIPSILNLCVSVSQKNLYACNCADAVSIMSVDLFHKLVFMPRMLVKCLCLLSTRETGRNRVRERSGGARDFADSIFTHQTELFPVSTWPNSRSHHLTLSLSIYLCFISLFLPLRSSFRPVPFQRCKLLQDLASLPSPCRLSLSPAFSLSRIDFFFSLSLTTASPSSSSSFHFFDPTISLSPCPSSKRH